MWSFLKKCESRAFFSLQVFSLGKDVLEVMHWHTGADKIENSMINDKQEENSKCIFISAAHKTGTCLKWKLHTSEIQTAE